MSGKIKAKIFGQYTSTKNQIVIPRDMRDALGVKAADRLLILPRGNPVILLHKPRPYSRAIAVMGKDLHGSDYLAQERDCNSAIVLS